MSEEDAKRLAEHMERVYDFLFVPPREGGQTRAQQLDALLDAASTGRNVFRVALWIAGGLIALGGGWQVLRDLWGQR